MLLDPDAFKQMPSQPAKGKLIRAGSFYGASWSWLSLECKERNLTLA